MSSVKITVPLRLEEYQVTLLTKKERRKLLENRVHVHNYLMSHQQKHELYNNMERWCAENCTGFYWFKYPIPEMTEWTVHFLESKDAVHFKLVWAGASGEIA